MEITYVKNETLQDFFTENIRSYKRWLGVVEINVVLHSRDIGAEARKRWGKGISKQLFVNRTNVFNLLKYVVCNLTLIFARIKLITVRLNFMRLAIGKIFPEKNQISSFLFNYYVLLHGI